MTPWEHSEITEIKLKFVKAVTVIKCTPHISFILPEAVLFPVSLSIVITRVIGSLYKLFPLRKSLNSHGSSSSRSSKNFSQISSRSSHEKSYFQNASYPTPLERRRTADHADILGEKTEERTERKLVLLQKSFECETEKNLEEFEETKYNVEFANSEIFTKKKKKRSAKPERKL